MKEWSTLKKNQFLGLRQLRGYEKYLVWTAAKKYEIKNDERVEGACIER